MVGITVGGVFSGLDVNGIIESLVSAEGDPVTSRLDLRDLEIQAELSAFGSLQASVSSFRDAVSPLAFSSTFATLSAQSSDTSVLSASASGIADQGNHTIEVSQLARVQSLASASFENTTDALGEGVLNFRFGTYDAGGNAFSANPEKASESVTIDSSNSSLQGIRDTVNAADIGVDASLVNDGTGFRLVLRSAETGAENSLEITVSGDSDTDDLDDAGLSRLAYDPTAVGLGSGKNLSESASALDALFTVDGLSISKPSNSVTDVVEGVTLTLSGTTSDSPVTLNIVRNVSQLEASIKSFVSAYNDLTAVTGELGKFDVETGVGGILIGDSLLRGLQGQLRGVIGEVGAGLSGSVRSLADIGISTQRDGTLVFSDSAALASALADNPEDVAALFAVTGSVDDALVNFVGSTSASTAGLFELTVTQLATQGDYAGTVGNTLIVDADNDTLRLSVDGIQSNEITLTQKTYATGEDLAAELQSRINADDALQSGGAQVNVSYQLGQLRITSSSFGSNSNVLITGVDTNSVLTLGLGPAVGISTDGIDVAGTIGGVTATGNGRILTGAGNAVGLSVEILGGALGSRSSVSFSRGFAEGLVGLLDSYLDSGALFDSRTEGLEARQTHVQEDRDSLAGRLISVEERLRTEFTQLELLLAQLQSTSEFLTQQLASFPTLNNRNN